MDAARKAAEFYGTEEPEQPEENLEATPMGMIRMVIFE